MKLITISVFLVLTVMGARACSASSPSSPTNPDNVARNGIDAVCAQEQANAAAESGDSSAQSPSTAISGSQVAQLQGSNPGGMQALQQALGGSFTCPTTTTLASP
jgi:hypothetical protein